MAGQKSSPSRILSRGVLLIAAFDIITAMVAITASTSQLHEPTLWIPFPGYIQGRDGDNSHLMLATTVESIMKVAMGIALCINLFVLAFGCLLLLGVRNGQPGLVYAWFIPNVLLIGGVLLIAFCLAFTRIGIFTLQLPALVLFRAFEAWIVCLINFIPGFKETKE